MSEEEQQHEWDSQMIKLESWNKICASVHLINGLVCLGLSQNDATISAVSIPIKTSFTDWNEDTEVAYQNLQTVVDVPIATVVSFIAFGAFYYHISNLMNWDEYTANVK